MSKEKQCECCHEWWYGSDVKEDLCPNCYYYFKQLKQQLAEKDKLLKCYQDEEKQIADILGDKDLTIIGSRVHLKNLIVELKNKIKDKDIVIEEKDKEIERLKNLFELNNEVVINQGKEMFDLRVQVLQQKQNQTQLAIQELEKVKDWLNEPFDEDGCFKIGGDLIDFIDQQIKLLKGEKDDG